MIKFLKRHGRGLTEPGAFTTMIVSYEKPAGRNTAKGR